jgi:hypothetical protein
MLGRLSQRLFPVLQLTRMALVFTAISNSLCTLLLRWRRTGDLAWDWLHWRQVGVVVLISCGLYGFGMSLNDIIDRRRDRQLAAHRPLPSGKLTLSAAHAICFALLALAFIAGTAYARWATPASGQALMSVILIGWTATLIAFYDYAGKYLVAPGLLSLGLIRFFHAVIPAPQLPLLWHPLLLLNHVTILSVVAYVWEQKRPPLTRIHWWALLSGLATIDIASVLVIWLRRRARGENIFESLWIEPQLAAPAAAILLFVLLAWMIRVRHQNAREAGQALMLYGLLWVIIYDVAFVCGYVGWREGLGLALLLPAAYGSVRVMRWWGRVIALSQRPGFKRAEG